MILSLWATERHTSKQRKITIRTWWPFFSCVKSADLSLTSTNLRQPEVSFIGHVATGVGLRVDPAKVKAIRKMPPPTDKAGVQRLLGLAQYLSKSFSPTCRTCRQNLDVTSHNRMSNGAGKMHKPQLWTSWRRQSPAHLYSVTTAWTTK